MITSQVESAQAQLHREKAAIRQQVADEFAPHELGAGEHLKSDGATERIYGGHTDSRPKELSLVKVQRPRWQPHEINGILMLDPNAIPPMSWEDIGVVHRVHKEDDTLTVQFPSDQHRMRVPTDSVQLVVDITPTYPKIRLNKGEKLPTRAQLQQREARYEVQRRQLGLPQGAMLPDQQDDQLKADEHLSDDGKVAVDAGYWGIPVPLQDALKNRSIPPSQVTGTYGRHFYTGLYERYQREAFEAQGLLPPGAAARLKGEGTFGSGAWGAGGAVEGMIASGAGRGATLSGKGAVTAQQLNEVDSRVISRVFIPLEGPQLHMNMATGEWEEMSGGRF
eukprot:TRINITY_DN80017_c0_g1_i1.p1 TRINITY_DN80017_c0_g1~~TRINITY_DN80017_c0_g1_i1.p1  ORF type:complete len:362 (-),score=51.65 TRINITY_DN80017_c0_g1_i1:92-1099(-)